MSRTHARLALTAVLAIGLMTMFAMPAAAQPEPDPEEGINAEGELDAQNQAGSLLAEVFGVTVLSIDCEFDQDSPTENPCEIVIGGQDVPPGDGAPGLPPELPPA